MAIIKSMGVGAAKKSMGNVTYRTVRGRTIGSQKVGPREGASTRGDSTANNVFSMVSRFMAVHASDIQVSFNKTRYGSQRNSFMRVNYPSLKLALAGLENRDNPSIADIESAISTYATANPTALLRVKLDGFQDVYMTGAWSSDDNPAIGGAIDGLGKGFALFESGNVQLVAPTVASINFHAGALIIHGSGRVTLTSPALRPGMLYSDCSYVGATGQLYPFTEAMSIVSSVAGRITFNAGVREESNKTVAVKIGAIYIRLTSAYVDATGEAPSPQGAQSADSTDDPVV